MRFFFVMAMLFPNVENATSFTLIPSTIIGSQLFCNSYLEVIILNNKQRVRNRIWATFMLLLIAASLVGCSGDKNNNRVEPLPDADTIFLETAASIREIAWNQISEAEKASVNGDWKKASVKITKWDDVPLKKASYKPESVYKVTFTTKEDPMLGPIGIYFDPATKKVVGYDARK